MYRAVAAVVVIPEKIKETKEFKKKHIHAFAV